MSNQLECDIVKPIVQNIVQPIINPPPDLGVENFEFQSGVNFDLQSGTNLDFN